MNKKKMTNWYLTINKTCRLSQSYMMTWKMSLGGILLRTRMVFTMVFREHPALSGAWFCSWWLGVSLGSAISVVVCTSLHSFHMNWLLVSLLMQMLLICSILTGWLHDIVRSLMAVHTDALVLSLGPQRCDFLGIASTIIWQCSMYWIGWVLVLQAR